VLNLEAVKGAAGPRPLYDFNNQNSVRDCIVMSDQLIGGSSKSNLDFVSTEPPSSPSETPSSYARFHGSISTSLPHDRLNIQRTGYAAFRTPDQLPTIFGRAVWDIDPYLYLAMRIKSDGRSYLINVQTESVEPTDLHQHRLFSKQPGHWETVLVRWNDFVRTNHGFVVEPQTELLRQKVKTVGIGLTDRVEGPFELCIERVWATNDATEGDTVIQPAGTELKNRKGERVKW
jgi:NADH dehydrogenase [ubiquinone] 1 alpha subcomplex assembly factor 1